MSANEYRNLSLWHDTVAEPLEPRAGLTADEQVDVVIVGAGFTGLWTAYYLTELRPGIRIAVLEAEIAGFGASGRNGGWCLGTMAGIGQLLHDPAQSVPQYLFRQFPLPVQSNENVLRQTAHSHQRLIQLVGDTGRHLA